MIYDFKVSGNYFKLDFDIQLIKDQQVYCFIGENGAGKTKLLQTLAKYLLLDHEIYKRIDSTKDILDTDREFIYNDFILNSSNDFKNVYITSNDINKYLPVIFISAKNRGYIGGLNNTSTINLPPSKDQQLVKELIATMNSIYDKDISVDSVTNWLLQRLMINKKIRGTEKYYYEALFVLNRVNELSPEMNWVKLDTDDSWTDSFSYDDGKFLINGIPIEGLSTGYASILRIVQEIVAGLCAWTNHELIRLDEVQGVVFIDEIDLHLHPKWQFKIIDLLKGFFPKVTFYITTHSPLVLFNLKNGEGYKLHKDDNNLVTAQPVEQNNMQFVGDVIKQFFDVDGVSIRKNDKQAMMQARKNLLDLVDENQDEQ